MKSYLKNIKLNVLPVFGDRYIKTKIRKYVDKVYTNFDGLNVPEHDIIISIDSLLVYENKYYQQVNLDSCTYKAIDKPMIDYLGENYFETDEDYF